MLEAKKLQIESLQEALEQDDEVVSHPIHEKLHQINQDIEYLENVIGEERFEDYSLEDVCELHVKDAYRKKIKGFHLAFNVKEKLNENDKSKY